MAPPFDVKLVVNEKFNGNLLVCSDSITKPNFASVKNTKIGFTKSASVVCAGGSITFTDTSSPSIATDWRIFGPVTINSTSSAPSINFVTPGVYSVELIVSYAGGCKDTIVKNNIITVNPTAKADFKSPDTLFCSAPKNASFTNLSSSFTSSSWTFSNGTPFTSVATNPVNINFSASGTIKLVVNNVFGCKDSMTKLNYVKFLGVKANFTLNKLDGCTNDTFKFTNTSVGLINDTIISYKWDFENDNVIDLTTTSKTNPSKVYGVDGCRKATLIIQTQSGCTDTNRVKICTGTAPIALYTVSDTAPCLKQPVIFTYTGTLPITRTTWYPRLPKSNVSVAIDTPFANNFVYSYTDTGVYMPWVVGENNGCKDTTLLPSEIKTIVVSGPKASFNFNVKCNINRI